MKILIGYDGSECAQAALKDLKRAGFPKRAEAHILSIAEVWLPPPPPSAAEIVEQAREVKVPSDLKRVYARSSAAVKAANALAQSALEQVKTSFPEWDVTAEASSGSPAWELVYHADHWKPDLIVVGSHGRGAIGRLFLGSVSQRVLTEAQCSVRVARGRVEELDTPVRIVIGIDGSEGSFAAVRAVGRREWPAGSEATLVVVDDPLAPDYLGEVIPPLAETIAEDRKEELQWVQTLKSEAEALLKGAEIKVSTMLKQGDPKHELPRVAEESGADCIFVGSTGFSNRLERFVLGSVSAAVAARAHCSVEVVRETKSD